MAAGASLDHADICHGVSECSTKPRYQAVGSRGLVTVESALYIPMSRRPCAHPISPLFRLDFITENSYNNDYSRGHS
ncbi:hypothetical protein E2C01_062938 [Portunus trituberculatus]|uniref:Uncharacterized protein n=1 Tax=Portunus trituberculatus TaxID=210409 RepID=A0A5B7H7W1_PORTR|nr:hypothetical protein [Portunus trituberculatus]